MGATPCTYHVLDDPDSPLVDRYTSVYNARRPSATVDDTRRSIRSARTPELRLLLERDGIDVAIARGCMPHPDLPDGNAYIMVSTIVDIDDHDAVADDLLDRVAAWLQDRGARTSTAWVRSDDEVLGLAYWKRRDFAEASRELVVSLDVAAARVPSPAWPVVTIADRPELEAAAYATYAATYTDMPMLEPQPPWTRAEWDRHIHHDPSFGTDLVTVALDGDDVVGVGMLQLQLARPGVAWHAMTGTVRSHRGRGIATAIKHAQVSRARAAGLTELRTGNDESNAAMRRVNERLGYRPLVVFTELVGTLSGLIACSAPAPCDASLAQLLPGVTR